jgi:hypothetical protein
MSDGSFQEAYARVRSRYSDQAWIALSPRQITDAIYREIRQIDAERNQQTNDQVPAASGGTTG